uniref:Probable pectate lyase F n=1 Tax=Radopholus similis TaxID=46012 RepID=A0A6C0VYQ3_RADSI|nr:pectate lyase 2 [Radopholus similis]
MSLHLLLLGSAVLLFQPLEAAQCPVSVFPTPKSTQVATATISVTKDTDFGNMRFVAGPKVGGTTENEKDSPILLLSPGVTVSNVIIGSPAAKGIWCQGSCTLKNVWWEAVATHAGNLGSSSSQNSSPANKYVIQGGRAQNAADKVFIQQGAGTTYISNFYARNVSKLWRSCGDCNKQYNDRRLVLSNSVVQGWVLTVVGGNMNYGDSLSISGLKLCSHASIDWLCQGYEGNTNYVASTGTNYKTSAVEEFKPGQTLNGKFCNDPGADITIVN